MCMLKVSTVCFYLSNSDAVGVKRVKDVIGKHEVNQRVFVYLQAKVLTIVPRESNAWEMKRPHNQQSSSFSPNVEGREKKKVFDSRFPL